MQGSSPRWLCWTHWAHPDTYCSIFKTLYIIFSSPIQLLCISLQKFTFPSAFGLKSGSVQLLCPSFALQSSPDPLSVRSSLRSVEAVICFFLSISCWGRWLRPIGQLRADRRSITRSMLRGLGFFSSAAGIGFLFRWSWILGRCFLGWSGWWSEYTSLHFLTSLARSQRFCWTLVTRGVSFLWTAAICLRTSWVSLRDLWP